MKEKLKYLIPGYGYYLVFNNILYLSTLIGTLVIVWQITVIWLPITLLVCSLVGS